MSFSDSSSGTLKVFCSAVKDLILSSKDNFQKAGSGKKKRGVKKEYRGEHMKNTEELCK